MTGAPDARRRAFWMRHLHQWHWISAGACLVGMLGFAATGLTLNHAGAIESKPVTTTATADVPADLRATLQAAAPKGAAAGGKQQGVPLPATVATWLRTTFDVSPDTTSAEWSPGEVYVPLPRPGGDAFVTIDLATGEASFERTDRGWIAYFNDLHKGRHTGTAWSWFLDIFAVACLVFCITGLFLLAMHARHRPRTWPVVSFGVVLPLVLALVFIH